MRSPGFTLPLALVAIGAAAFGLASLMSARHNAVLESRRAGALVAFEVAASSANARLLHLLLSEPMGARGVRVGAARFSPEPVTIAPRGLGGARGDEQTWRLDGRIYRVDSQHLPLLVAGQDVAGLLNAQLSGPAALTRWFTANGAPNDTARRLGDDITRTLNPNRVVRVDPRLSANGPAPIFIASTALLTDEVRTTPLALAADRELGARARAAWINPNTAAPNVLIAVFGLTPRQADVVIDERQQRVLDSAEEVASLSGALGDAPLIDIRGAVARTIRVRIACDCDSQAGQYVYESWLSIPQEGDPRPFSMRKSLRPGTALAAFGSQRAVANAIQSIPEPRASRAGRGR